MPSEGPLIPVQSSSPSLVGLLPEEANLKGNTNKYRQRLVFSVNCKIYLARTAAVLARGLTDVSHLESALKSNLFNIGNIKLNLL